MNTVNVIGRVGNDIDLQKTTNGKSAVRLSLAIRRNKETTDWVKASAYDKNAETIATYVKKGDLVGITGSLYTEEYIDKKSQEKHYATKIFVNTITLIGGSNKGTEKEAVKKDLTPIDYVEDELNLSGLAPDDLPF